MNRIIRILKQEAELVFDALMLAIFSTVGQAWVAKATDGVTALVLFAWLFVTMLWCAFRVVHEIGVGMIVLNGLIGLALPLGGLRHHGQNNKLQGARGYITLLLPLSVIALVLPRFTILTSEPTLSDKQEFLFALLTIALYSIFVILQTSCRHSHYDDSKANIESHDVAHEFA